MISKQLTIKKIMIISRTEESSIEIPLSRGLNIILGENKTGKSSLIKTIFYSFGCEVKFDEDWEKLNKRSFIIFCVGNIDYLLERQDNTYYLFKVIEDIESYIFEGSYTFSDFSRKFLELFNIKCNLD
jgi:AAA15 family ATPase/GTPase